MKKFSLIFIAAMLPVLALAQQKIATVNIQAVYDLMPEKAAAEASLRAAADHYQREYQAVQQEFGQKYADYQTISGDPAIPGTIKERRMQEIQENDKKIQQFLAQADSDLVQRERQLSAPIRAKISEAVAAVAAEQGITYVFDVSDGRVAYSGPDAIDITPAVKSRLGL